MKRWILLGALVLVSLWGCAPRVDPDAVVVWTAFEGSELRTLQEVISEFKQQTHRKVELLKVPFSSLKQKMLVAGPAGQGPDLLICPHDWIGQLYLAGLLAPIPKSLIEEDFYDIALRCVQYQGQVFALPLNTDCLVLARNPTLCPQAPQDLAELVEFASTIQRDHDGVLGFAYALTDFYFTGAFLEGFGADLLAPFRQSQFHVEDLDFASPQAVAGAQWIYDLGKGHRFDLVPLDMKNQTAVELFTRGRLAMMVCGPWNLGELRASKVSYELSILPRGPVGPCSPFVGVSGVVASKKALEKNGTGELLQFLGSPEVVARLCLAAGRAPARRAVAERIASQSVSPQVLKDLQILSDAAQQGVPMPNHPAVGATFWPAMQGAFELILRGLVNPQDELTQTTERVRTKIRFMTE